MAYRDKAQNVRSGQRIRWMGAVRIVERVRVESLSSGVSIFVEDERLILGWNDPVEIVDDER